MREEGRRDFRNSLGCVRGFSASRAVVTVSSNSGQSPLPQPCLRNGIDCAAARRIRTRSTTQPKRRGVLYCADCQARQDSSLTCSPAPNKVDNSPRVQTNDPQICRILVLCSRKIFKDLYILSVRVQSRKLQCVILRPRSGRNSSHGCHLLRS